jgi:HEAT repeat protein
LAEDDRNLRTRLTEWQTSQSLRGDVALTLAQLGYSNDRVVAAFLAELENRDASVRERIVRNWWLLGKHNSAVLAPLQAALQDEAEAVRQSAAASLHRLNHGERKSGN